MTHQSEGDAKLSTLTSAEDLIALVESLVVSWELMTASQTEYQQRGRQTNVARFVSVNSFCTHAHRIAPLVVEAHLSARAVEAVPLVRTAFQSAMTAMWFVHTRTAGEAFAAEEMRQRAAGARTMLRIRNPTYQDAARAILDEEASSSHKSAPQAKNFEALCDDLEGGANAYLIYRVLSSYSHANLRIVDNYVVYDEAQSRILGTRTWSEPFDPPLHLFLLAASLVWAGMARNYLDPKRARRSELKAAARALGIDADLELTAEAKVREDSRRRAARRAVDAASDTST